MQLKMIFAIAILVILPGAEAFSSQRGGLRGLSKVVNPFQRRWFLCKGQAFQARTAEEKAAGMESINVMKCTKQMTMKELCCAPWKTGLAWDHTGLVDLPTEQDGVSGESGTIIKVLTQSTAGMDLMEAGQTRAVSMPVECLNENFEEVDLSGNGNIKPGEMVLRARTLYFMQQGIPAHSVPTCAKEVATCPDGTQPSTVGDDWLAAQTSLMTGEAQALPNTAAMIAAGVGAQKETFGFGGMMTSGSFMMMSSGF